MFIRPHVCVWMTKVILVIYHHRVCVYKSVRNTTPNLIWFELGQCCHQIVVHAFYLWHANNNFELKMRESLEIIAMNIKFMIFFLLLTHTKPYKIELCVLSHHNNLSLESIPSPSHHYEIKKKSSSTTIAESASVRLHE